MYYAMDCAKCQMFYFIIDKKIGKPDNVCMDTDQIEFFRNVVSGKRFPETSRLMLFYTPLRLQATEVTQHDTYAALRRYYALRTIDA